MVHLLTNVAEYAIILNDKNEFLLVQWGAEKAIPLSWHFPGGRLDEGERELAGLSRELQEEISAQIIDAKPVFTRIISQQDLIPYGANTARYAVFYLSRLKPGCAPKLNTTDHCAIGWFSRKDLPNIKFWLPFYREMLEKVLPQ